MMGGNWNGAPWVPEATTGCLVMFSVHWVSSANSPRQCTWTVDAPPSTQPNQDQDPSLVGCQSPGLTTDIRGSGSVTGGPVYLGSRWA